jgi:hypothetical protein
MINDNTEKRKERQMSILVCILLMASMTPSFVSAHTIHDVLKNPVAFDQQSVTLTGEAANVVTRYGEATSTTFDLRDEKGAAVSVLVSQVPKCKQGEICRVSGLFVAEKNMVLPEKIERISESKPQYASILFQQRANIGTAGRTVRGIYIPQQ